MNPFPSERQAKFFIPGPAGQLEVLTAQPEKPRMTAGTAVICHPHPLYQGTMDNKVVYTLARAFSALGLKTIRFNFRGVGKSEGEYDNGIGETDDVLALLQWLKTASPNEPVWLAGFSFGAYVAARAAKKWPVAQLISVAPPIESFPFKTLPPFPCPWTLIQGDEDEIVSSAAVFSWAANLNPAPHIIMINGGSHFFHGKLIELRDRLIQSFS